MQYKDAALGDTLYFWFAVNGYTGTAEDGTTPLFDVRLAGAAAGAAPVLSGTPTLLTHADYSQGLYEIAIVASTGNGFAAGNEYAVFCTLSVTDGGSPPGSLTPAGFVGSFKLKALAADLNAAIARVLLALPAAAADGAGGLPVSDAGGLDLDAKIGALAFTVAGDVDVNVQSWKGAAAPDVATETDIAAAVNDHISAAVDTPSPDTNTATSFKTTLTSAVDNFYKDMLLTITSGALDKQVKKVTDYDGTNKIITVATGFTGTPADGVTFDLVHQ